MLQEMILTTTRQTLPDVLIEIYQEEGQIDLGEIFEALEYYGPSEAFSQTDLDNDVHNEEEKAEDIDPDLNLLFEEATISTSKTEFLKLGFAKGSLKGM